MEPGSLKPTSDVDADDVLDVLLDLRLQIDESLVLREVLDVIHGEDGLRDLFVQVGADLHLHVQVVHGALRSTISW
jgi:hypothetical protein